MKITFPVKALEDKGEDGESVMPSAGDMVDIPDVTGTVESIDGDMVTVNLKSIGGCDCEEKEEAKEEEPTEESVKKMMEEGEE